MNLIDFLKETYVTNSIQAISSFILVIITAYYAYVTRKILYAPHKSYLRPMKIDVVFNNNNALYIQVKNFGPALAINIKIYAIVFTSMKYSKVSEKYFNTIEKVILDGPIELPSQSDSNYTCKGIIEFYFPIVIKWESINGKKQKSSWLINVEDGKDFVYPLTFFKKIRLKSNWLKIILMTPFVSIKKKFLKHLKGESHL